MNPLCRARLSSRALSAAILLCCLPLILMLAGCGSTVVAAGGGSGGGATNPTVVLTAAPGSIVAGAASILTVTAANATAVTIKGSDGSSYNMPGSGGTQTITPTATTSYTATATGAAGTTPATATVTVTVTAAGVTTVAISANPLTITPGGSSVLTVTATNATTVTITGSDGSNFTLQPTGGTVTVKPTATTTYTASAVGAAGSTPVTQTATVTVSSLTGPTVALTANPTSITNGASSVLTVTATNATQVTLTGTDGTNVTLQPTGGTQTVSPTATATYTATATGTAGTTPVTATTTVTVTAATGPSVTITSNQASIIAGNSAVLTVTASNATSVTVTGTDNSSYTLSNAGGSQTVSPTATTTYTATASGATGTTPATQSVTLTVVPAATLQSVQHVVFMLQENHSFDNFFGMLNPYRASNNFNVGADGKTYAVDGIDDKLNTISNQDDQGDPPFKLFKFKSTCIDDLTSSWLESYGDVSRYDYTPTRAINMDGFVHTAQGFTAYCTNNPNKCSGTFSDTTGQRAMGFYDQGFLNYYYYMASQFALSDRWFSPVSSKSVSNRIATYTGGTTQGLAFDPGNDDQLPQLGISTIFSELTAHNVSWKIYYTVSNGGCKVGVQDCSAITPTAKSPYPATDFSYFSEANQYLYAKTLANPTCTGSTHDSSTVGDSSNSFCIDTTRIAPITQYYLDASNNTLPEYAFIEAGYGVDDEHPGSGNSILDGQAEVAQVVNSLMGSPSWTSSVFFLAYDEGGGPYDHVPPVPTKSNQNTDAMVGSAPVSSIPDISTIAVSADSGTQYKPCIAPGGVPTIHCDLHAPTAAPGSGDPGSHPADAAAISGFPAQLGFRVPDMIISPFVRKHYVGHTPMDHTAILKFVEDRFIPGGSHLTPRVAAQPDLLDFFDFTTAPWTTPPTPPTPLSDPNRTTCTPTNF